MTFLILLLLASPAVAAVADGALTSTTTAWELIAQYGPIWGGMLLAFAIASEFVKRNEVAHWIGQGRALAAIVGAVGILGSVLEAQLGGGSWAGVVVTLMGAVKMFISPQIRPGAATNAAALLVVVVLAAQPSCKQYIPPQIAPVVDCVNANRPAIDGLIDSFWPKDGGSPVWSKIESQAIDAGVAIGGCALMEFAQKYLTPAPGNRAPADGAKVRALAEDYRAKHANGATFDTPLGKL